MDSVLFRSFGVALAVCGGVIATPTKFAAAERQEASAVSPALGVEPSLSAPMALEAGILDLSVRSIDGAWNNLDDPEMGAAFTRLSRWLEPDYGDDIASMTGQTRPGAREISNMISAQAEPKTYGWGASDMVWQWGQFLDHDLSLTGGVDPPEPANIEIPEDDEHFTPGDFISFNRSIWDLDTGVDRENPRQQINQITAWIDASNVYASDPARAEALREMDGTGRLRVSDGNLLPFNLDGLPNAGGSGPDMFLAGDVRANEQVGLTALHTLFAREHNRLARIIADARPNWTGDQIYEEARFRVGVQMQVVTYKEFLPVLLGPDAIGAYEGYDPGVNAQISNVFSTAAFRLGHSALSPKILRLDARGAEIAEGHLPLRDAFFAPHRIIEEGGIEPLLRGLISQPCQFIDPFVVDDVRNFLFGDPDSGGFDLAALNIQRARDHGLPSYNDARIGLGMEPALTFSDISSDPEVQFRLSEMYDDVNDVDIWVGGLSEDPLQNSMLGELFHTIVVKQFTALRDGDRFWYENVLSNRQIFKAESVKLSDIIKRNTNITREIGRNAFVVEKRSGRKRSR